MSKVTREELDQIKSQILDKLDPASNNVQITDVNAVKLCGTNNTYVVQYIVRKTA